MSFESIAYIIDTYMWFLFAALLIGVAVGWLASDETQNTDTE